MNFTRTTLLGLGFLTASLSTAGAVPVYTETVVHDTTTQVELELDASTVLCSSADYGALFLKVLIPDLSRLTLLDHQNTGAGAPCVAAGSCHTGQMPDDIIDPTNPNETVSVNVKSIRADESDADAQTCNTSLVEKVHVTIRGIEFFHERTVALGSRAYADCAPAVQAPDEPATPDDGKADEGGQTPAPEAGGCSAGHGGAGSLLGFALLGLAVTTTRRRKA